MPTEDTGYKEWTFDEVRVLPLLRPFGRPYFVLTFLSPPFINASAEQYYMFAVRQYGGAIYRLGIQPFKDTFKFRKLDANFAENFDRMFPIANHCVGVTVCLTIDYSKELYGIHRLNIDPPTYSSEISQLSFE